MRLLLIALAASAILAHSVGSFAAEAASGCWRAPPPQTLQEVAAIAANQERRRAGRARLGVSPATLALSNPSDPLKAAYGAGLLVGWGEAGNRPGFARITAVGVSALVAPFAFLGAEGDRKIADLFACEATSLSELADRATNYIDAQTLDTIARRHDAGARLQVALPGSATRRETVWDLGAIAASRHPKALRYISDILYAAVDLTTFIDPVAVPVKAGSCGIADESNMEFDVAPGTPAPAAISDGTASPAPRATLHQGALGQSSGPPKATPRRCGPGARAHRGCDPRARQHHDRANGAAVRPRGSSDGCSTADGARLPNHST